ncbi:GNAT family N-acetyltransferase [Candidatus Woesebacteria bacterium]|nr:GNAT family N-acetyltransferase [Candidatus Woesebacteria bacterium]
MPTITNATLADATSLTSIISSSLDYTVSIEVVSQRIEKILQRDDHLLLVAKIDDQVVGFCHGYLRLLTEVVEAIEIGGLAVTEEHRGKGVAKQLVTAIEDWAKTMGCSQVVLASNIIRTNAHAFYEHLGYKKIKQQFAFEKNL